MYFMLFCNSKIILSLVPINIVFFLTFIVFLEQKHEIFKHIKKNNDLKAKFFKTIQKDKTKALDFDHDKKLQEIEEYLDNDTAQNEGLNIHNFWSISLYISNLRYLQGPGLLRGCPMSPVLHWNFHHVDYDHQLLQARQKRPVFCQAFLYSFPDDLPISDVFGQVHALPVCYQEDLYLCLFAIRDRDSGL